MVDGMQKQFDRGSSSFDFIVNSLKTLRLCEDCLGEDLRGLGQTGLDSHSTGQVGGMGCGQARIGRHEHQRSPYYYCASMVGVVEA